MSIQSPCSISYVPEGGASVALCAQGGWLDGFPRFTASQDVLESDGMGLSADYFRPLGAAAVVTDLMIEMAVADFAALQSAFLTPGTLTESGKSGTFYIENAGSWSATFPEAVLGDVSPDLPAYNEPTLIRTLRIVSQPPIIAET